MVCFVILNWNKADLTMKSVQNLTAVERSLYGIIVVDNGSKEDERGKLVDYAENSGWTILCEEDVFESKGTAFSKNAGHIRILLLADSNYGYAKGNNLGLKLAKKIGYEWAVVMNNDVILEIPVLETLLGVARRDPKIAMIGPRVIGIHGERQSPFAKPSLYDYFLLPIFYPVLYPFEKLRNLMHVRALSKSEVYHPYSLQGSFVLLNLKALEQVGWFDEKTFLYAEEIILSEKMLREGYKVAYVDKVYVRHLHRATTRELGKKRIMVQLSSTLYYFRAYRNYGPVRLLLVRIGFLYNTFILRPIITKIKGVMSRAKRHYLSRRGGNKAVPNDTCDK